MAKLTYGYNVLLTLTHLEPHEFAVVLTLPVEFWETDHCSS